MNLAKQNQSGNNNLGFCHIVFEDEVGFKNALLMNGQTLDGRYLDVIEAKGPHKLESKYFKFSKIRIETKVDNI